MKEPNDCILDNTPRKMYYVGCIQDNTFWSYCETPDRDKAIERASNSHLTDKVEWCVFEQTISYNKIASFTPKS
jgi:hypothetical protein